MSIHQANKDKPRAQKCRHFCFSFDMHNYCPTCREAGKGDDPCVTFETPCDICASFTDDQGKYIKLPPSTSKWYRVGQPCYQDKYQELNTDFAKICITPKPSGAPMGKVPLPILKESEHQARQNISTLNFTAASAKTSSSCNASLEKCQHSIKSTVKKIKSQIQKGANPEKAASADMRKSLSTWIFGIRQFLFNTGPLHASANP